MSFTLGQFDKSTSSAVEPGIYDGIVEGVHLVLGDDGQPKETESGKNQIDVNIRIDRETSLRRRMTISFGQNKANGQWAVLAKFIEAATGIKCGDKAQRNVQPEDLVGKQVRFVTEINANGYNDITSFMPPQRKAAPQRSGFTPPPAQDDDHVPFPDDADYERR